MARGLGHEAEQMLARSLVTERTVEVRRGLPSAVLVRASGPTALTVVGSHGHARPSGVLLGSVSQHVARHAAGPVVVVREPVNPRAERIVVGMDGSAASTHALEFACAEAASTGRPVSALYGRRPADVRRSTPQAASPGGTGGTWPLERWMSQALADVREKFPNVRLHGEAVEVAAARALADASTAAALVVVGSRGRGAFAELLLGSVAQAVLQHAQCPVAVVH